MKKGIVVCLLICVLFSLNGCSAFGRGSQAEAVEAVFSIESYEMSITADSTFAQTGGGNFDLQITNEKAYISIMAYKYIDLPQDLTTADVYQMQNEDLFSKRESVSLVETADAQTLPTHVSVQEVYSAKRDGIKNYYATYLIDFPEQETFAWVLITAEPSYFKKNKDYLHDIVCSLNTETQESQS